MINDDEIGVGRTGVNKILNRSRNWWGRGGHDMISLCVPLLLVPISKKAKTKIIIIVFYERWARFLSFWTIVKAKKKRLIGFACFGGSLGVPYCPAESSSRSRS